MAPATRTCRRPPVQARQIVGSLDTDDVRVAGLQRAQVPALELGTVGGSDVPQLLLIAVTAVAGVGSQARLVRLPVTVGRQLRAENVLVVVPTRQEQLQAA